MSWWELEHRKVSEKRKLPTYLSQVEEVIDFEAFRPLLEKEKESNYGAKAYDRVLLWKITCLQKWYGLSDEAIEAAIGDRVSFQLFLSILWDDPIPDATTLCHFRKALRTERLYEQLFKALNDMLEAQELKTVEGCMVDVTFVAAPKGKTGHKTDPEAEYGYKGHGYSLTTNVDKTSKLIHKVNVSSARPHDSKQVDAVLTGKEKQLWADSAFSESTEKRLQEKGIETHILKKGKRNHPLTPEEKAHNRFLSKTRARVEHPYATLKLKHLLTRTRYLGLENNRCDFFCHVIAYNLHRAAFLFKSLLSPPKSALFLA
jgi:IS5 family transposase